MTDNSRVPQKKNSKLSAANDDNKLNGYICCRCGKIFSRQTNNFPVSKSPLYAGNNGYLPFCKSCVTDIFQYYLNETDDPFNAAETVCSRLDIYFCKPLFESLIPTCNANVLMTSYIGRVGISENKNKTYDDNISENKKAATLNSEDLSDKEAEIIERGKREWGLNLSADDYEYLDNEFSDWNARCAVNGKTRESLVREICVIKLQQNKALLSGDIETYNKLSATFQKTLTTAELTPRQETDSKRATEKPMGVMIEMFENDRPTPEPNKEWEDVDGIQVLIRVFFIGHLCKMLGVKNKYSAEYEEYMARYSADIPEDAACDDSEDIYDYLMEHGFSEDSAAEESEAEDINDSN